MIRSRLSKIITFSVSIIESKMMRHVKKQETIKHNQKKYLSIEIVEIKMIVLRDKGFKRPIINKLRDLKENMNIRLKETENKKTKWHF